MTAMTVITRALVNFKARKKPPSVAYSSCARCNTRRWLELYLLAGNAGKRGFHLPRKPSPSSLHCVMHSAIHICNNPIVPWRTSNHYAIL